MENDIKTIRAAVEANCGGFKNAPDSAVRLKWRSLNAETRKAYIGKATPSRAQEKTKKKGDADASGT